MVGGEGRGREERPHAVGPIPGQIPGAGVETEGEVSGEVFFRVVGGGGVAVGQD